jgi:hypothetical protein
MIALQQQIAGELAARLRSGMSTVEKQMVTKQGTQNAEAYDLYTKGRYAFNKRTPADLQAAISYFNQAIAKDPGYALAYSGLADTYSVLPSGRNLRMHWRRVFRREAGNLRCRKRWPCTIPGGFSRRRHHHVRQNRSRQSFLCPFALVPAARQLGEA